MSEKNYLQDSGRIDLDNSSKENNSNEAIDSDPKISSGEPDIEIEEVDVTEKSEPSESNLDNNNSQRRPYEPEQTRPKVLAFSAIIAGVLIMIAGYVSYKYFSNDNLEQFKNIPVTQYEVNKGENVDYDGLITDLSGRIASGVSTSRAEEWQNPGDSFGIVQDNFVAVPTAEVDQSQLANITPEPVSESNNIVEEVVVPVSINESARVVSSSNSNWVANDYSKGDIESGSYTVVSGDTLWEIAEAVYGNGSDWHKIAEANGVTYMFNGNPLIIPGQVLNIPS